MRGRLIERPHVPMSLDPGIDSSAGTRSMASTNQRPKYLLIAHVPFGRGSTPGRFVLGDMWLYDLRAQRDALRQHDVDLVVACPLKDVLRSDESGSFGLTEIDPREEGFVFAPLPFYRTLSEYLRVRSAVKVRLRELIAASDVVHLGDGAHPVPLHELAWPIADSMNRLRIWVYDGADVVPRLYAHAKSRVNPIKRIAWTHLVRRRESFSRRAIRAADLTFAHNAAVVRRFADVWNERCHVFDRSYVTEDTLISTDDLAKREVDLLDASRPLRLVVASRQIAIKATDHVIMAIDLARRRGVDIELDVLGDGEDLQRFRDLARQQGIEDRVRFHGAVPYGPELFRVIRSCHSMVVPNLTPEISRNLLLSMALGIPVIAYRNPGTDDLIENNDAGCLVPTGSVSGLADCFVHVGKDRQRLVDIARRAREVAAGRTLEACHRVRAALAFECVQRSKRRSA